MSDNTGSSTIGGIQGDIADIEGDLAGIKLTIGQIDTNFLKAEEADLKYATIENLNVVREDVHDLNADYATFKSATANEFAAHTARIDTVIGDLASYKTTVTDELIAAKGWMAEGAIGNAQISSVDANKLRAGTIDTALVTIAGSDGKLQIADNTMKISDANRVRVQVGKDASGDYTLAVWDKAGNLIWDALGATDKTIQRKIIRDNVIADDAAIQALKIDFQSFDTVLTDQGVTISGTVVQVGSKTLNVALSEQTQINTSYSEQLASHASKITANEKAIALKVSSQTYEKDKTTMESTLQTVESSVNVMDGQITALVQDVTVLQGDYNGLDSRTAKLELDSDSFAVELSSTKKTVSDNYTSLKQYTDTAKSSAISTAAADATSKANKALADAKTDATTKADAAQSAAIASAAADATSKADAALKSAQSQIDSTNAVVATHTTTLSQHDTRIAANENAISLKVWSKDVEEAVSAIEVGGRNLLLKSGVEHSNNTYDVAHYTPSSPLTAGETYTISVCVTPGMGLSYISPYLSIGYAQQCVLPISGTGKQIISRTFKAYYHADRPPTVDARMTLYRFPNDGTVTSNTTIHWIKVEKGTKPTDWTPAPEDIDSAIATVDGKFASYSTTVEMQSAIEVAKTEINLAVSETYTTKQEFGALEIGGRNLLLNSNFKDTYVNTGYETSKHQNCYATYWGGYNSGISNPTTSYHAHINTDAFEYPVYEFNESDGTRNWKAISQRVHEVDDRGRVTEDGEYIFSLDVYSTLEGGHIDVGFYYYKQGNDNKNFWSGLSRFTKERLVSSAGTWKRYWLTMSLKNADFTKHINIYIYGYGFDSNAIVYIKNVKLEKGNRATDWTPAPEDTDAKITSLETWKTEASQKITKDGIIATVGNYYAYQSDLNTAENRITQAESTIVQQAGEIALTVKEQDVTGNYIVGKLNLSSTTAKIAAKNIDLSGYVTVSSLKTAGATTIDGSNITTGTISADRIDAESLMAKKLTATNLTVTRNSKFSGVLDGATGSFSGSITATSGKIGAWNISDVIHATTVNGNYIYLGAGTSENQDVLFVRTGTDSSSYRWSIILRATGEAIFSKASITGDITATSIKLSEKVDIYKTSVGNYVTLINQASDNINLGLTYSSITVPNIVSTKSVWAQGLDYGGQFNAVYGNYGVMFRNDGSNFYILVSNPGDQTSWQNFFPFIINLASGKVEVKTDFYCTSWGSGTIVRRPVASSSSDGKQIQWIESKKNSSGTYYITVNGRFAGSDFSSKNINCTTSDIRLKTNVVDCNMDALSIINQIQVREFDWKESGIHQKIGFVADELEAIDSNLAFGGGYNEDGSMDVKSVNEFYLVGYLTKGIQELHTAQLAQADELLTHKSQIEYLLDENAALKKRVKELEK